ncbi:hypothetical protein AURDEDRAFT_187714 [Auricularia subglabra TFB-10046 SS5]|nr:hypothetical protein AURDEDRAFT_187714 [Auricularia subglabra TFB-10046 SS5]
MMATVGDLPLELLSCCFLPLPFRDRIRASHVSKRWRRAATEFPEFWSTLTFDHESRHHDAFLSALRRSGASLLDATWAPPRVRPYQGLDTLVANMSRVRALAVRSNAWTHEGDEFPAGLLSAPAPQLEELYFDSKAYLTIPGNWGGTGAPRLRSISVNRFGFDASCGPFHALRRFRGSMRPMGSARLDPRSIFRLCPALAELELCEAGSFDALCLAEGPIPPTLTSLLFLRAREAIDYQPLLDAVMATLPHLELSNSVDILPALRHYATYAGTRFRMACTIRRTLPTPLEREMKPDVLVVRLENGGPRTLTCETSALHDALDGMRALVPHMQHLAHLECATEFFAALLRQDAALPFLESLTLRVSGDRPYGDLNYCHFKRAGRLRVPRLRALIVDAAGVDALYATGVPNWLFGTLPATVSSWLQFDDRKLDTVHLFVTRGAPAPVPHGAERAGALLSWAARVFVGWKGDWEKGLFQQGIWYS